jgi:pantoate kinase
MYLVMGFFSFPRSDERHHAGSSGVGVLIEVRAERSNNVE